MEEREGRLYGFEFKWKEKTAKVPSQWADAYPDATFETINNTNFEKWLE